MFQKSGQVALPVIIFQVHTTPQYLFSCLFVLTLGHESALDDFGIYEFVAIPDLASGSRVGDFTS